MQPSVKNPTGFNRGSVKKGDIMQILMVTPKFSRKHGGGGLVITSQLSKELAKNNDVTVYTSDYEYDQEFVGKHVLKGINVKSFKSNLNLASFHFTLDMIKHCKKEFKEKKYDIIHLQCYRSFQNAIVCYYARKYGIPYILDSHGMTPGYGSIPIRFFKWIIDLAFGYKLLRGAALCIAETKTGIAEYEEYGVGRERIRMILPARDLSEFDNLPEKGEFKKKRDIKEKHMILFLGGIDHIKGVDFLVKSFIELCKERDDTMLVLAGADFGLKKELDKLIDAAKLNHKVLYTGFISGRDKLEMIRDADMMVMPSRREQGLPFSGLESLMCLTPLIVTEHTGAGDDVVNMSGGGFLIKMDDIEGLKKLMISLINDPEKTGQWSALVGKHYVEKNFSINNIIKEHEDAYKRVISGPLLTDQEYIDLCKEKDLYG